MFEIHGSAIVGIHKTKIPKFTSLIEVWHSRARHLHQDLRQTIHHAIHGDVLLKFQKVIKKAIVAAEFEDGLDKLDHRSFVSGIGHSPSRMYHGLTNRLNDVCL